MLIQPSSRLARRLSSDFYSLMALTMNGNMVKDASFSTDSKNHGGYKITIDSFTSAGSQSLQKLLKRHQGAVTAP